MDMNPHEKAKRARSASDASSRARPRGIVAPLEVTDEPKPTRVRIIRGNMQVSFVCPDEPALDDPESLAKVAEDALVVFFAQQEVATGTATLPIVEGTHYRLVLTGPPELVSDFATGLPHRERVYRLEDDPK
jgi:hypothetical protein